MPTTTPTAAPSRPKNNHSGSTATEGKHGTYHSHPSQSNLAHGGNSASDSQSLTYSMSRFANEQRREGPYYAISGDVYPPDHSAKTAVLEKMAVEKNAGEVGDVSKL